MNSKNAAKAEYLFIAALAVLVCALWAFAQRSDGDRTVSGTEDLCADFRWAQLYAPASEDGGAFVYDAGFYTLLEGGDLSSEAFAAGLVPCEDAGGRTVWPVSLFEDPATRETVFINADGEEVVRLSAPEGYDPLWVVNELYPEGLPAPEQASDYDPSRVVMSAVLGSAINADDGTSHAAALAPDVGALTNVVAKDVGDGAVGVSNGTYVADSFVSTLSASDPSSGRSLQGCSSEENNCAGQASVLYADSDVGHSGYDGSAATVSTDGAGPKATVQQAIDIAGSGDIVQLSGQAAFGDVVLNPGAKHVVLRSSGHVRF